MYVKKKDIDNWIFDGDEKCCDFCKYKDNCSGGVVCYGGAPCYPYCTEHDNTEDYIYYDDILDYLEENMKETLFTLNLKIEKVVFNEPATIVFWSNGDKTVVKCQKGDKFDKEKGIALAVTKYVFGNKSNYNNTVKKFIDEDE